MHRLLFALWQILRCQLQPFCPELLNAGQRFIDPAARAPQVVGIKHSH